jgi:hypothetical protein
MRISNKMGIGKNLKNKKSEPLIHASILELVVGLDLDHIKSQTNFRHNLTVSWIPRSNQNNDYH